MQGLTFSTKCQLSIIAVSLFPAVTDVILIFFACSFSPRGKPQSLPSSPAPICKVPRLIFLKQV